MQCLFEGGVVKALKSEGTGEPKGKHSGGGAKRSSCVCTLTGLLWKQSNKHSRYLYS